MTIHPHLREAALHAAQGTIGRPPEPRPDHENSLFATIGSALPGALRKFDPRQMVKNPVMFIVEIGAVLITAVAIVEPFVGGPEQSGGTGVPGIFSWSIALWLWATVLFANLAESIAEGRGKAQAESLRRSRSDTPAHKVTAWSRDADPGAEHATVTEISSATLVVGDHVVVEQGVLIPGDGEVIWGIATVDESAITGESAPVVRESGGDRSSVTGGTRVLSDRIVVEITAAPGKSFVDRMIALVEGAERQKTPNETALNILLASLSIVFMVVALTLNPIASFAAQTVSLPVLVALIVCLIPTTIGALLPAIGIAGMDRLVRSRVLAKSGRAVEAAGDVTELLMDKTGTITYGNRRASEFLPLHGIEIDALVRSAAASSIADPTPEGASIIELAAAQGVTVTERDATGDIVPFSAQLRMSGLDRSDGVKLRKGAGSAIAEWVASEGGSSAQTTNVQEELDAIVARVSNAGGTPLVVAEYSPATGARVLGVVYLKDVVKEGLIERFTQLRAMGIRTVMVTGDNPLTAAAIAREAGVDDFIAEARPEDKLKHIRDAQARGALVAMTGDGTNDAPALAQADVGVAMNSGTSAAKEAGNMIDLDSDPSKLIEIVAVGKQLLITRGALTTFSIANDIAKYFAIIPAMFAGVFPGLGLLNIMGLSTPASAVVSAIIFNAIIIVVLVPLALRGVKYRPLGAAALLNRNLLIYGIGGVIAPFIGIKLIDMIVSLIPGF